MALDGAFVGTAVPVFTGSVIADRQPTGHGRRRRVGGSSANERGDRHRVAATSTQPVGAVIDAVMLNASRQHSLSFLGDNLATSVTAGVDRGGTGGIAYKTAADAHVISATAASGDIDLDLDQPVPAGIPSAWAPMTASAGNVTVTAERAILDDNGAALNITGQNIWLTSTGGGSAGGLAISMDTQASGWQSLRPSVEWLVRQTAALRYPQRQRAFRPAFNASSD
jgi:hypothetical protein